MPPVTLGEGVRVSERVVVAEFRSWRSEGEVGYFAPPWATYEVVEALKGGPDESSLELRHTFHDLSPCLEPEGWVFDPATMPREGSRWILFLQGSGEALRTWRGNAGRLEATPRNIERVRCLLRGRPEAKCR